MIYRTQRATGSAAIAMTIAPGQPFQIDEVRVHLNAVGGATENLTITLDSGTSAVYDTVLLTQAMAAASDVVWKPDRPYIFNATDEVDIAYANTNTRTYGVEVIYSTI